ncbi:hypothetical protein [Microbacterium stercoris]|uniref:Polyketide cyclase / dehydrase and lipid transport n=1 Tax=Microbacterium stercoris TaxID=2820289 RepID=A0A939QPN8_9MICO|nr:hypothetical protein [Microbacterium stercoris]MBO3662473.1 hypothetical protein [Microbacterium stercoris]MBO3664465.1 hypothetical protein [Microbacterium stercoris]
MYSFRTIWRVAAPAETVRAELTRVAARESGGWWPGFRVVEPASLEPGSVVRVVVTAPFGYRLRVALEVTEATDRTVAARSTGDLEGAGRVEISSEGSGSAVRFTWEVAARRRWMRASGPVLRPVFALAHALVMRAGERGLRRAVASGVRKPANASGDPGDSSAAG